MSHRLWHTGGSIGNAPYKKHLGKIGDFDGAPIRNTSKNFDQKVFLIAPHCILKIFIFSLATLVIEYFEKFGVFSRDIYDKVMELAIKGQNIDALLDAIDHSGCINSVFQGNLKS